MALPVPNLDDRRFQDLVDDAKRLVQRRCPEWTDHNVSDPGVTLIEAFATMVDQLLYRLNRVPDAHYLRFLDLIGVRLHPPTAACCDLTFWLAAPREDAVTVPADTEVATQRTGAEEPVVFSTVGDLVIPPCRLEYSFTSFAGAEPLERGVDVPAFSCFGSPPRPDDAVLFGLSDAMPGCAILLRMDCEVEASASTPATRRWCGRPGPARAGRPARSTGTPPAGSTSSATSCCTYPRGTSPRSCPGGGPVGCAAGWSSRSPASRSTPRRHG
jgi:hypothetical protein